MARPQPGSLGKESEGLKPKNQWGLIPGRVIPSEAVLAGGKGSDRERLLVEEAEKPKDKATVFPLQAKM